MTLKGYDTSFQPPDAACMYAQGFRWVLGYVGPGSGKFITPALRDQYHAAGLNIGFLVEGAAGDILAGPSVGAQYADEALSAAEALGAPVADCVFCLAADVDIISSDIDAATNTYRGFNSVLGLSRSGVYGDTDIIARLHDDGLASWFFLTAARAWDTAPIETYIDVYQVQNGINGCGGNYDLNTASAIPRGLWAPTKGPHVLRYMFTNYPDLTSDMFGYNRVHVTDGVTYRIMQRGKVWNDPMTAAGAGPITTVDGNVTGGTYAAAVSIMCGRLDTAPTPTPTTPSHGTWEVTP